MFGPSNDKIPAGEWKLSHAIAREVLKDQRKVKRANAKFAKSSPGERRTIIAQDVLKWLDAKKLRPGHSYLALQVGDIISGDLRDLELDKVTTVNGHTCVACARGGLFAAIVERRLWRDILAFDGAKVLADREEMHEALRIGGFEPDMAALIECAYEGDNKHIPGTPMDVRRTAAVTYGQYVVSEALSWHDRIPDDEARMRAIMENIARNGGDFVPADHGPAA